MAPNAVYDSRINADNRLLNAIRREQLYSTVKNAAIVLATFNLLPKYPRNRVARLSSPAERYFRVSFPREIITSLLLYKSTRERASAIETFRGGICPPEALKTHLRLYS